MAGLSSLLRKVRRVAEDPTLRQWLRDRSLGRARNVAVGRRSMPDYLAGMTLAFREDVHDIVFPDLEAELPKGNLDLSLPGEAVHLTPDQAGIVFDRSFADTESLLALHRFAWLASAEQPVDPAWLNVLWRAWLDRFAMPSDHWAWHPYTAAERIINILSFARTHGLPGPRHETIAALVRHGPAIAQRLEYFGEGQTGNHLANNGRGLYLAGLALGFDDWVDMGGRILVHEAHRIFCPSGVLQEGSSHYHLLVARWFWQVARAAAEHGRAEQFELQTVAQRALAVVPHLLLPGGLPLIGDVSPDLPPHILSSWASGAIVGIEPISTPMLDKDGWIRGDFGNWHALWYVTPDGWPPMPGHGHRDLGGFELHRNGTRLFCDLGRRTYGPTGEQDIAASSHNTLMVDGMEPSLVNRPYYDAEFRRRMCGAVPSIQRAPAAMMLNHQGFKRLGTVGEWQRTWRFSDRELIIEDRIDGHGRHKIDRYLQTARSVRPTLNGYRIDEWILSVDAARSETPIKYWPAYGTGEPATRLRFENEVTLPWTGRIHLTLP